MPEGPSKILVPVKCYSDIKKYVLIEPASYLDKGKFFIITKNSYVTKICMPNRLSYTSVMNY